MAGWRPAVLLAAGWAGTRCLAQSFRDQLLEVARQRNGDFYRDSSNLDDQKSADGVEFSLSKESKDCAGDGIPLTFLEYDIESAGGVEVRPVDAFNVLSDPASQPQWDPTNKKGTFLGDFEQRQARGFSAVFNAKPVTDRELYEWMIVYANFTSEEFWVLFTSLDNTALQQRKPADEGTTPMQNCMGATRITKTPKGLHIVASNQPNAHTFPLDPVTVANIGWKQTVDFAVNLRKRTLEQAKLRWNATKTVVPKWMLEERPCGAQAPDTEVKEGYLSHAARILGVPESEKGTPSSLPLDGGGELRLWESRGPCSAGGSSADTVPVWQASFKVPEAKPADVFNVLVNKSSEPTWNAPLTRVNETGFSRGARGLHEEYSLVSPLAHRELWEWQAAAHNLTADREGGTYLIAIASVPNFTEKFAPGNVEAAQCMAAYQVAPDPDGGSIVNMTSQFDPNIFGAPVISKLWPSIGRGTIKDFAEGLINQSRRLATARARGAGGVQVDGGALALLAPAPPGRNASATLASVLDAGNATRLRLFADLDLPRLLDASAWAPGEFQERAAELLRVFDLVRANATAAENITFLGGPATDAVAMQLQGLALASVQGRVLDQLAKRDCQGPALPDIDGNKSGGGITLVWAAVACAVVMVLTCATCGLCCARCKKRRRERMARAAGVALLEGAGVEASSAARAPAARAAAAAPVASETAKGADTSTTASLSTRRVSETA